MGNAKVNKRSNDYADQISSAAYELIPKSVLAAVAVSALTCGGDRLFEEDLPDEATIVLVTEWNVLHENGIVPQPVPAKLGPFIRELSD